MAEQVMDKVGRLSPGPWHRFQEQFFYWSQVLPGIDVTICDEDAMDEWLDRRLDTNSETDIVKTVATGGVWHPPGSRRASMCLCDSCDQSTASCGCFTRDGLDVCGNCAREYVPQA